MGSSGACARAGVELATGAGRPTPGSQDSSMVPKSFKALVGGFKPKRCAYLEVLPVSRRATYEMSLGVFQLLFMQSFLWNAGIGWTIPNRNSCECLPLIKPLACTNTLHPAETASRIWFWSICFPPLWCRYLQGGNKRLQPPHLWASCCVCSAGIIGYVYFINITPSLMLQNSQHWWETTAPIQQGRVYSGYGHCEIQSVKLQLVKPRQLHDKGKRFHSSLSSYSCRSLQLRGRNGECFTQLFEKRKTDIR